MNAFLNLLDDLEAESAFLVDFLEGLQASDWELPSTAAGWAIRDQVSHLAFFDDAARTAATDPSRFRVEADQLWALGDTFPDIVAERYRGHSAEDLLAWFVDSRRSMIRTFRPLDGATRVPWFGPGMSLTSSATARLMETWAHGLDIAEAFGAHVPVTPRIRHIAHLGVRTLGFSFALRGFPAPTEPVYVRLEAGDGEVWEWGDALAANAVTGSALDFCRLVTQRVHRDDTDLVATGRVADAWLSLAQAFAGAPGPGRPARNTTTEGVA